MWKGFWGKVMAYSWYYTCICLDRLRKTTKISVWMVSVLAMIQTKHPPNTSLGLQSYINMLGICLLNGIPETWLILRLFHIKSREFRGKIFITISDSNIILQACYFSFGNGIYEILLLVFVNCRDTAFWYFKFSFNFASF
jgi:hypothetical protein